MGEHHALVGELRRLVDEHPLRERSVGAVDPRSLPLRSAGRSSSCVLRSAPEVGRRARDRPQPCIAAPRGRRPPPGPADRVDADAPLVWPIAPGPRASARPAPCPLVDQQLRRAPEPSRRCCAACSPHTRLVTLTGPGGCGKTRLALEGRAAEKGCVVFVELASVADGCARRGNGRPRVGFPEDPLALGHRVAPGGDRDRSRPARARQLRARSRRIGEGRAAAVAQTAQRLRVLVTSRRILGITGETRWPVPPLALPTDGTRPGAGDRVVGVRGGRAVRAAGTDRQPDLRGHAATTPTQWSPCAGGWTACRSRSSSPRRASRSCRSTSSARASPTRSASWRHDPPLRRLVIRRCAPRSTRPTTCSVRTSKAAVRPAVGVPRRLQASTRRARPRPVQRLPCWRVSPHWSRRRS